MARYIVLRLDKNESAERLLEKFRGHDAIDIVGVFASTNSFCEGKSVCGEDRTLVRSRRWGTVHCSECKRPVTSVRQQPRNLLLDADLHPRFVDLTLSVWEPYMPPEKKYGEEVIERKKEQARMGSIKMKRHKNKKRRSRGR